MGKQSRREGRERWLNEEQFINNRLTWLGFTQTLLFGAYVGAQSVPDPSIGIQRLVDLLPILGLCTSLLILMGVGAAISAMYELSKKHKMHELFVTRPTTFVGWFCSVSIPISFVLSWAWLLVAG